MKKLFTVALAVLVLTSCSFETSMCPSYGGTKRITKYGTKAQLKYGKHRHV